MALALNKPPKTFGPVFVEFDGLDSVQFALADPTQLSDRPAIDTPVDVLLASVGHCIVKSIQWAANQREINLNAFSVEIIGTKALNVPNRLAKIDMAIIGQIVDDTQLSQRILQQAKAICTVSNSMNCDVTLSAKAD